MRTLVVLLAAAVVAMPASAHAQIRASEIGTVSQMIDGSGGEQDDECAHWVPHPNLASTATRIWASVFPSFASRVASLPCPWHTSQSRAIAPGAS